MLNVTMTYHNHYIKQQYNHEFAFIILIYK